MHMYLSFIYFLVSLFTCCTISSAELTVAHDVIISDHHIKIFFKKHGLDITRRWQDAIDALSNDDIFALDNKIPESLANNSQNIANSIRRIILLFSPDEIMKFLGISLDKDRPYTLESINLIENFGGESFYIHTFKCSNLAQFRHAFAECTARHFDALDLENRRSSKDDQSLLSEPYCALHIDRKATLSYNPQLETEFYIIEKNNKIHEKRKQLLFEYNVQESRSLRFLKMIKLIASVYFVLSGQLLPRPVTMGDLASKPNMPSCGIIHAWKMWDEDYTWWPTYGYPQPIDQSQQIQKMLQDHDLSPHCLEIAFSHKIMPVGFLPTGRIFQEHSNSQNESLPLLIGPGAIACFDGNCVEIEGKACTYSPRQFDENSPLPDPAADLCYLRSTVAEYLKIIAYFKTNNAFRDQRKVFHRK